MNQFGWANCPAAVGTQVNTFIDALQAILGDKLVGVYLHGSLAMGMFQPRSKRY